MINLNKPGRPTGNKELRNLRSKTWLLAVRARSGGKSNCYLSILFGPRDHLGNLRSTADRLKMFEAINKNGSIPGDGSGKRGFDLVARVDSTKGYEGTSAIIHSPFWKILGNESLSLTEIRTLVVECVELLDLAKQPGVFKDDGSNEIEELVTSNPTLTFDEYFEHQKLIDFDYDMSMSNVFPYYDPNLNHIALVGALSLEAIYAGNMKIAKYHIDIFDAYLEKYCKQEWLCSIGNDLYSYGKNCMLNALQKDPLNGLPSYSQMLTIIRNANPNSAVNALLARHQRMLWRR